MNLTGQLLGKYEVREELGWGGMAVVYRGYDPALARHVAIKVLDSRLARDQEFVQRFLREARAAANLDHPNIVRIHDVGQQGDLYYFVMALLTGKSLADIVRARGPLRVSEVLSITEQIAGALDYAHEHDLVHRDVKSSNIIVDETGRAVLTDFGIVHAIQATRLTSAGTIMGTPEYMAPEQARGEEATGASDIYSLGVVVYEMLAGEVPFSAPTPTALLLKHMNETPPPLRARNIELSEGAEAAVLWALAKEPGARPTSGGAFAAALRAAAGPLSSAPLAVVRAVTHPAISASPGTARAPAPSSVPESGPSGRPLAPGMLPPARRPSLRALGWILLAIGAVVAIVLVAGLLVGGPGDHDGGATPMAAVRATDTVLALGQPPRCQSVGRTWVRPADSMIMVCVPAGPFTMGSTAAEIAAVRSRGVDFPLEWLDEEQPQHTVDLAAFWVDRTEVTNAQYGQCVAAGACPAPQDCGDGFTYPDPAGQDNPVGCVDWAGAQQYCAWAGGRLPTEAEWEKTARGTEGWIYPWGGDFEGRLNYCDARCLLGWKDAAYDDGYAEAAPVGSYLNGASPYGAMDMAGNVWEWVGDWFDGTYYARSPASNPSGPASGAYRPLRGGSWDNGAASARSAFRFRFDPIISLPNIGFRCVVPSP